MKYSIKEAQEELNKNLKNRLSFTRDFSSQPNYKLILDEISSMLEQLNNNKETQIISISKTDNTMYFKTSDNDTKYILTVFIPDEKNIIYQLYEEGSPRSIINEDYSYKKVNNNKVNIKDNNAISISSTINLIEKNPSSGEIYVTTNSIHNRDYNKNGIMTKDVYLRGPSSISATGDITQITKEEIANYEEKYILERNTFDTARFTADDKVNNIIYNGIISLDQSFGLRDMHIPFNNRYPTHTIIKPLSKEEINQMISKEPNEQVRKGLEILAHGRENYSYNSKEDKKFVYEINEIKPKLR